MSEFKLIGNLYISEWNGSSLNDGSNPLTPESHPSDVGSSDTAIIVIGSGYYSGGWSSTSYKKLYGDGKVIIDALGGVLGGIARGGVIKTNPGSKNIHFKNSNPYVTNSLNSETLHISDECIFENCNISQTVGSLGNFNASNCIFINNPLISGGALSFLRFYNCIIIDSIVTKVSIVANSFISKSSKIVTNSSANFAGNLCNGLIQVSGIDYELKFLFDGTPRPDADPLIPDLATASGFSDTYTTRANFAGDPKFIDVINRLVDPDSDLLKLSNTYGYIGGVKPGKVIPVNSTDPDVTITTTDIDTTNPLNWLIQAPATEGFINITWKVSETITEIQTLFLDALLSFDGSEVGGSIGNNNVPDIYPTSYSPLTQTGLTPNRLTYELRTSQSIAKPTQESQWDNDSIALGTVVGDYYVQEWNTKPTITTVLGVPYGNGNPEAIGGSVNGINARWAQARIRLTNNRTF